MEVVLNLSLTTLFKFIAVITVFADTVLWGIMLYTVLREEKEYRPLTVIVLLVPFFITHIITIAYILTGVR